MLVIRQNTKPWVASTSSTNDEMVMVKHDLYCFAYLYGSATESEGKSVRFVFGSTRLVPKEIETVTVWPVESLH